MEQALGVEPNSGDVGDVTSHHVHLRDWSVLQDLHLLPLAYQASAHLHVLRTEIGQRGETRTHDILLPRQTP